MARILYAEDDKAMREMVTDMLTRAGHQVDAVSDGASALAALHVETPELVVLDYRMGVPDGFEVCRRIKEDPRLEHLPVLLLTAQANIEDRIRGFEAGADDYLPKPFDARELLARVHALLRLSEQGRGLNPTTGLPGGTAIERELARRGRGSSQFTLCYLDLDNFKSFNDHFGFATANAVIEGLGRILRELVAGTDFFAGHVGGDDFVVLCEPAAARPLVEAAQRAFREALPHWVPTEVLERGWFRGRQRDGTEVDIPLTGIAAALLHLNSTKMPPFALLGEVAADAKQQAKRFARDGIVEVELR